LSPWFRRKRKQDEQQAAEAAPAQPSPPEAVAPESPPADAAETDPAKKRRRGNRGGRGRKKPGTPAGEAQADPKPEGRAQQPARRERKPSGQRESGGRESGSRESGGRESGSRDSGERSQRQERRANQSGNRRRVPQKRAPLPKAKRELLISVDVGEQRVAILEDDRVAEVYLERPERRSIAGNIYLGTVDNVLPGMEAAFVEIGLEKNGFLYVDEIVRPELEGKSHGKKITDLIARGQEVMVQAVKDPMKTKGARLTMEISLPGRFLVFVPQGEGLGVSRRLDDAERARLKEIIKGLEAKEGGIIVRTAAEGASAEDIERDLVFLQRLWKTIQAKAKAAKAPALVYQEAELPLRIVRDLFAGDFESAIIDHDRTYKRIVGYLKKTSPGMLERVHHYKEKTPLFEGTGVDAEIRSTLSRRVDLPSGGYLVFDYAEAFTVIDVNTGRFVGSRSKNSGARLEDTITKNNLEAVKEVVRQLRLRDIGGIIVIDFIDMANPKNRAAVEEALRSELERDRTKTYVVEISPLGLVEMTRQNVTDGPREILTKKCPTCEGDGIVVSEATAAMEVERRLRTLAAGSRAQAFKVEVSPRTAALLIGAGAGRLTEIEAAAKKRFFFVPKDGAHADHVTVLEEGKLADLQPEAPVAEGTEVELKLVELARHDAQAAAGKLDGLEVVVGGAAKLVGKKAKVRIERVLDGSAYATLLSGGDGRPDPITFESEAEKPTRAPSRAKKASDDGAAELATPEDATEDELETPVAEVEAVEAELEPDADESEATDATGEAEETVDGVPVKKKTRRGSRGGRNRKKKPAEAEDGPEPNADADSADAESAADGDEVSKPAARPRAPRIHVPGLDRDPEAKPKPRSRPRVAAEVADAAEVGDDEVAEAIGEPTENGAEPTDGEPAVKKKTRRGSRGGRNRKKPAGAVAGENGADGDEADGVATVAEAQEAPAEQESPVEPVPVAAAREPRRTAVVKAAGDDEYVPMSEWADEI